MQDQDIAIHWFRQDLRLSDNPAFTLASEHKKILPIYILDNHNAGNYVLGGASRWWLNSSLVALDKSLSGNLSLYCGDAIEIIKDIVVRFNPKAIYWNQCYEPWRISRDEEIKNYLQTKDIKFEVTNGSLLWKPEHITKKDGSPYKVFTPFYRKGCLQLEQPRKPLAVPKKSEYLKDVKASLQLHELELLSSTRWEQKLEPYWEIGEQGAYNCLHQFIKNGGVANYKDGRNLPARPYVSRLSPYLRFGEISPNQVWYEIKKHGNNESIDCFCSELGWREFAYNQLYHNPELPIRNLQPKFDNFAWNDNNLSLLSAWQNGITGVPMVDAGMRELWQTGHMHNRLRMIVGSFLVKNLRLHWHYGERWFWDTLVDADLASNSASWQWIAGCGADAAPYFRIFNPVTQGQKFDSDGEYIRKFVPEIASLPNKYIFSPWTAPNFILKEANIKLGVTYPEPIIDLMLSRKQALIAFKALKK